MYSVLRAGMDDGFQISPMEIKGYYTMLHEPNILMCRNLLKQNLFSRGITTEKGELKELEEPYLRFLEDAFDYTLSIGFVPYRIVEQHGERIPVVCPPDSFDAYVLRDNNGAIQMTLYERNEGQRTVSGSVQKEIKDSHVFLDFGYNPTSTGGLNSPLQSLRKEIFFGMMMRDTLQKMEVKRSDPPVLTETTENAASGGGEDVDYGFYADADLAEEAEAAKFRRTDAQMKAIRDQRDIYRQWLGEDEKDAAPTGIFPLPSGQKYVNTPLPEGRHDFVQINRSIQDMIFGVMGVPRTLIFSDGTHKGDQEGTHRTFEASVAWWKRTLGRCASEAKIICDAKSIVKTIREKRKAEEVSGGETEPKRVRFSAEALKAIKRDNMEKFVFPTVPSLRLDEVHTLYDRGAMDWKQYLQTVGILTGLKMNMKLPEPVEEEEDDGGGGGIGLPNDNKGDDTSVRISKDGEVSKKGDQKNPVRKSQTDAQNEAAKKNAEIAKKKKKGK